MAIPFFSLPPELLSSILNNLCLPSLLAISQTCQSLRHFSFHSPPSLDPWPSCVRNALLSLYKTFQSNQWFCEKTDPFHDNCSKQTLIIISKLPFLHPNIDPLLYSRFLLAFLPRSFILYELSIPPTIGKDEWEWCMRKRFWKGLGKPESFSKKSATPRSRFMKTLTSLEHAAEAECYKGFNTISYLLLHRTQRLTQNRQGARDFNPLQAFEILKRQSSLFRSPTRTILLPEHISPWSDMVPQIYFVTAPPKSSRNTFSFDRDTYLNALSLLGNNHNQRRATTSSFPQRGNGGGGGFVQNTTNVDLALESSSAFLLNELGTSIVREWISKTWNHYDPSSASSSPEVDLQTSSRSLLFERKNRDFLKRGYQLPSMSLLETVNWTDAGSMEKELRELVKGERIVIGPILITARLTTSPKLGGPVISSSRAGLTSSLSLATSSDFVNQNRTFTNISPEDLGAMLIDENWDQGLTSLMSNKGRREKNPWMSSYMDADKWKQEFGINVEKLMGY